MKIATVNVNGVNDRLPVLLRWLAGANPDVVCLIVYSELFPTEQRSCPACEMIAENDRGFRSPAQTTRCFYR